MPFLTIDGRNVYYEVHGQGEAVVLLHHGFAALPMWKTIYPVFVKTGFQVIMSDRRGYGRSEPGDDFAQFYTGDRFRPAMVEELRALLDALDVRTARLVGQCEGGVTGVDFAAAHPDRVHSLVLGSMQTWSHQEMAVFNKEKFPEKFQDNTPKLRDKLSRFHGGRAEELWDLILPGGGGYGSGHFDLRLLLPRVPHPALVIYPDRSSLFGLEQALAQYRGLPAGQLAVMPDCGHNTYEYRPEEYARLILEFYQRLDGAP